MGTRGEGRRNQREATSKVVSPCGRLWHRRNRSRPRPPAYRCDSGTSAGSWTPSVSLWTYTACCSETPHPAGENRSAVTCNSTKECPQYTKEQLVLRAVLSYGLLVFLSTCIHSTNNIASFPGPAQLSVAFSTEKRERAWNNLSREWRRGREKGREDLIERRRIVEVPTYVVDHNRQYT